MEREPVDWSARTSQRQRVSHVAAARFSDGREARVLVTDISYEGCRILAETEFAVGDTFTLVLPGRGSLSAQVRWTNADVVGARFITGQSTVDARRARIGV